MTMILDGTNGAFLPTWTTGTRPASPANGQIGYNSTTGQIDQYVGSAWSSVPTAGASQATATALGTVYAKQTTGGGTPFLTAFGYNAGVSTTGAGNTAMGTEALFTNSTGTNSTAIGYQAGYSNTTGMITAFGKAAGYSNTTGFNLALGNNSFYSNTTGNGNVAVGSYDGTFQGALFSNTTGLNNVAVGSGALASNTTANNNTAVGYIALNANTTGVNTAVGRQALYSNTTGTSNTAVGGNDGSTAGALQANTSGLYNTAVGTGALQATTTTSNLTAVGYRAGYSNNGGDGNSNFGTNAGYGITTGNNNVCIGTNAGYGQNVSGVNLTTGGSGIYVGGYAYPSASSNIYEIVIGYSTAGKGSSTGYINPNGGGVYQGNNQATWSVASDQRLKKNIVDNTIGLSAITQIQVRNFEYRTENEVTELTKQQAINKQGLQLGVIAQELQAILPDCVKEESTGVLSVNSDNIMWHMINAIKELNAEINALKAKIGE